MRAAVLMGVLALPLSALAQFNYLPFKMVSSAQTPFQYYVDGRSQTPAGLSVAVAQAETEAAWATWNAVQCAAPKAQSRGLTGTTVPNPPDAYDNFSVTPVFVTNNTSAEYRDFIGNFNVSAITVPLSYAGVLLTCDVYLNAVDRTWSTVLPVPGLAHDLQSVMVHEVGHCLGLDHFGAGTVMQSVVEGGTSRRALHTFDTQALCTRNPLSGALGAPCLGDGGCGGAASLKCVSQTMPAGPPARFCSQGCATGAGPGTCGLPLACQSSLEFNPSFDGACLMPSTGVTQVGKPCANASECGAALSLCEQPELAPSGGTFWTGGYCTQSCLPGQPACPVGGTCTLFTDGRQLCMKSCRVGLADCRGEYACLQTTEGGICIPRCFTNADCGDQVNFECRTCDGLCVAKQNPSAQVGDVCTLDTQCGTGQVCLAIDSQSATRVCTVQCGKGCGACPAGASCQALERGDLYCLRSCAGPGTCPPGLRCGDQPGGKACVPACSIDANCPVGQFCRSGECLPPDDGGACGSLCNIPDGGRPIVPTKKDGGTGTDPGTAGCGCTGAGGAAGGAWALLGALLWLSRRRV